MKDLNFILQQNYQIQNILLKLWVRQWLLILLLL
jgi:hypothetical protein